jgi:hypothetical protein
VSFLLVRHIRFLFVVLMTPILSLIFYAVLSSENYSFWVNSAVSIVGFALAGLIAGKIAGRVAGIAAAFGLLLTWGVILVTVFFSSGTVGRSTAVLTLDIIIAVFIAQLSGKRAAQRGS